MDNVDSKPFRFLDLPLELQCLALAKYYEEAFFIRGHWNGGGYLSNIPIGPLLVSRQVHKEAKIAIAQSRGNTYEHHAYAGLPRHLLNETVTHVRVVDIPLTPHLLNNYMQTYQNLVTVKAPPFLRQYVQVRRAMRDKNPLAVLRGNHDAEIRNAVQQAYDLTFAAQEQREALSRLVVVSSVSAMLSRGWMSQGVPQDTEYWVYLNFEIIENKCHLVGKAVSRRVSGVWQDEDMEHVVSMLEQNAALRQ